MNTPKSFLYKFARQIVDEYGEPHLFTLVEDLSKYPHQKYHTIIVDFLKKRNINVYYFVDKYKGHTIGGGTDGFDIYLNIDTEELVIGSAIHEWLHIIAKKEYHYIDEIYEIVTKTPEYQNFLKAEEIKIRRTYSQHLAPEEFLCKFLGLDGLYEGHDLPCYVFHHFFYGLPYKDIPKTYQNIIDILNKCK